MAKEGALIHEAQSPTAATVGNKLFPSSGAQVYRVLVKTSAGFAPHDVEASTGDEAAETVLRDNPGAYVANVTPAPQSKQKAA